MERLACRQPGDNFKSTRADESSGARQTMRVRGNSRITQPREANTELESADAEDAHCPPAALASQRASGGQPRRFERAIEKRMWLGFFVNWPGWGRHGSMNRGRDPRQQAVGRRDVIRGKVLHGLGGVIEVASATLVVVVSLVLPVQLEMRKVRDSTRHRPGAGQCQRLPKHGKQQNHNESGTAHGSSLSGARCPERLLAVHAGSGPISGTDLPGPLKANENRWHPPRDVTVSP